MMAVLADCEIERNPQCRFLALESAYESAVKHFDNVEKFSVGFSPVKAAQIVVDKINAFATQFIADAGSRFSALIFKMLKEQNSEVERIAFYDSYEHFVPGGYSERAAEVIQLADKVLFGHSSLINKPIYDGKQREIPLDLEKRLSPGYFLFGYEFKPQL